MVGLDHTEMQNFLSCDGTAETKGTSKMPLAFCF